MICLQVQINDKVLCIAGVGDFGVLTSNLTWVNVHPSRRSANPDDDNTPDLLFLTVGGLTSNEKDEGEHLRWLDQHRLKPGDELLIRVLNQAVCDEPKDRLRD